MTLEPAWIGRIFLRPGALLYAGPTGTSALHAHHAFQIVVAPDPVVLRDRDGKEIQCRAAVIPPDAPHARDRPCPSNVILYVDPDDAVGRRLRRVVPDSGSSRDWARAAAPLSGADVVPLPETWPEAEELRRRIVAALVGDAIRPRPVHPAVMGALRLVAASVDEELRVAQLARELGISQSRLSHAFSAEVGIPLKRYILWARLQTVGMLLQRGSTPTEAAHGAGFADGPHMSRAFRRMFGLAPSDVAGLVAWVPPPE